jgi:hypothetical protein
MNKSWNFAHCVSVLAGEIELLKKILAAQESVRRAVMSREWANFDEKEAEVNRLGGDFVLLEDERTMLFSALSSASGESAGAEKPFYTLIIGLPMEERRELSRLYRELRMETLKIRALNETFLAYLNEAKSLTTAYIEAVCPARGGKLYTRKGRRVSQDLRSIVLNNRF